MPPEHKRQPFAYEWLLPLMTLGLVSGIALAKEASAWQPAALALAAGLSAALLLPGKRRIAALMLASAALGALITFHAGHQALPDEGEYLITGVVTDEILLEGDETLRLATTLDEVTLNGEPHPGSVYWTAYTTADEPFPGWLRPGVRLSFTGEVYHPDGEVTPGGYDFRTALLSRGSTIGVYGREGLQRCETPAGLAGQLAALRHRLTLALQRVMGTEEGALAAAMLLGSRSVVADEDYTAFRELGIAHILSVSGYHVGVLAVMLMALLRPLHLPRKLHLALLTLLLALYALLTGAAPPVIRAGLLVFLREAGQIGRRRNLSLHLLCLAAACQLLANPMQLFSASFQLTYCAMLGLVLIYPRLRKSLRFRRKWARRLWKGLAASVSVQIGLLPAQLYWFNVFPLASVVVNIPLLALTSILMALYWLMLALLPFPIAAEPVGALAGTLTQWLLAGIRWLADVIGSSIWTPSANLLTLLGWALLIWGMSMLIRRSRVLFRRVLAFSGAILMVLSLVRLPNTGVYWLQFSDGEADGALLHDHGAVVLVDAGETAFNVAGYLRSHRLSVDALILTHLHADHACGIEGLLENGIPVKTCYLPEDAFLPTDVDAIGLELLARLETSGTKLLFLSRGDVLTTPSGRITVLWPQTGTVRSGQSANDACLVLQAELLGTTLLLAGDMTSRYEMYVAAPADILKAAHHGSAGSNSPAFLQAVAPQAILLSCGETAREETLLPRAEGIPVYSTHSSGAVTIRFTEGAFTVETCLPR